MTDAIFAIQLTNKHTGETCWLGISHPTREAAKEYAEHEVCPRCNRYSIWPFPAEWKWVDRHRGFMDVPRRKDAPYAP